VTTHTPPLHAPSHTGQEEGEAETISLQSNMNEVLHDPRRANMSTEGSMEIEKREKNEGVWGKRREGGCSLL